MEKRKFCGLIIALACLLIFSPAAAWHADVVKSGPQVECPTCEFYTYTITVNSLDWNEYMIKVQDTLPVGLTFVSSDPAPSTIVGQTLTWYFSNVPAHSTRTITLNVKPSHDLTSVSNKVFSKVKACYHFDSAGICTNYASSWEGGRDSNTVTTRFDDEVCPSEVPEFPSAMIPVTFVVGLLGMILCIQRIKE